VGVWVTGAEHCIRLRSRDVRYVAFLRGINVGGKTLIRMGDLRASVEDLGHADVSTYIASGNVLFSSPARSAASLEGPLEQAIELRFALRVRVFVRSARQLAATVAAIPAHWPGNAELRCNVIFLARDVDVDALLRDVPPKPEIEEVVRVPGALLWAARRDALTRSRMLRLAGHPTYGRMTVRNLNTVLALARRA
jgi:uncharacterized protein (DUF1697 family)